MSANSTLQSTLLPTLRQGDKGKAVQTCQGQLCEHGYPVTIDGDFGAGTAAAVVRFQQDHSLGADGIIGPKTWTALLALPVGTTIYPKGQLPPVLLQMQKLGYQILTKGDYHLNLFGIRSPTTQADRFDDILGCAYTVNGQWREARWAGTTDPGSKSLQVMENSAGCAILVEGQYLNTWKIDLHAGKYEALCQRAGEVRVYRDSDRDTTLDMDAARIQKGTFGINLHHASYTGTSTAVQDWSAGCQVHASITTFEQMMALARKQVSALGLTTFSYTLLRQWW